MASRSNMSNHVQFFISRWVHKSSVMHTGYMMGVFIIGRVIIFIIILYIYSAAVFSHHWWWMNHVFHSSGAGGQPMPVNHQSCSSWKQKFECAQAWVPAHGTRSPWEHTLVDNTKGKGLLRLSFHWILGSQLPVDFLSFLNKFLKKSCRVSVCPHVFSWCFALSMEYNVVVR